MKLKMSGEWRMIVHMATDTAHSTTNAGANHMPIGTHPWNQGRRTGQE